MKMVDIGGKPATERVAVAVAEAAVRTGVARLAMDREEYRSRMTRLAQGL